MRRRKRAITGPVRREVCIRYGAALNQPVTAKCAYCDYESRIEWTNSAPSYPVLSGLMEYDHVIPEALGGPTVADNLVLACKPCNRRKGANLLASHPND